MAKAPYTFDSGYMPCLDTRPPITSINSVRSEFERLVRDALGIFNKLLQSNQMILTNHQQFRLADQVVKELCGKLGSESVLAVLVVNLCQLYGQNAMVEPLHHWPIVLYHEALLEYKHATQS